MIVRMKVARALIPLLVLGVTLATPARADASHGWHTAWVSQDLWPRDLTTSNGTGDRIVRLTPS